MSRTLFRSIVFYIKVVTEVCQVLPRGRVVGRRYRMVGRLGMRLLLLFTEVPHLGSLFIINTQFHLSMIIFWISGLVTNNVWLWDTDQKWWLFHFNFIETFSREIVFPFLSNSSLWKKSTCFLTSPRSYFMMIWRVKIYFLFPMTCRIYGIPSGPLHFF